MRACAERVRVLTESDDIEDRDGWVLGDATGGTVVATLPSAVGMRGHRKTFTKIDDGVSLFRLDASAAQTINGELTWDLAKLNSTVTIESDGANWIIVAGFSGVLGVDISAERFLPSVGLLSSGYVYAADELSAGGAFLTMVATNAALTADVNDYAIDAGGSGAFKRLSSDASRSITGILAPVLAAPFSVQCEHIWIVNVGAQNIVLVNNSGLSSAPNRIITGTGANVTLTPDASAHLIYDTTSANWRVIA